MAGTNVAVGTLNPWQIQQVLATAEKAPAVHHVRPWRFHCTATTIEMLLDLPGARWGEPDDHRAATVACGAALLNLRLAIRSFGVEPVVRLMPAIGRPTQLAAVQIGGSSPVTRTGLELSLAIRLLETQVRKFQTGVLSQAWIALPQASALPSLRQFVNEPGRMKLLDPYAHVAIIGTVQDDPSSRLRAGQAMQRVLLTATTSDLSSCFIAMADNCRASRGHIRGLLGGGLWPQALLQIGRPAA
jgi:nitroreductase